MVNLDLFLNMSHQFGPEPQLARLCLNLFAPANHCAIIVQLVKPLLSCLRPLPKSAHTHTHTHTRTHTHTPTRPLPQLFMAPICVCHTVSSCLWLRTFALALQSLTPIDMSRWHSSVIYQLCHHSWHVI